MRLQFMEVPVLRFFSILFSLIPVMLALAFAGIIIDVGLTSIYAHFGWEFWPTFTVIGLLIGIVVALSDDHWRVVTPFIYAGAGHVFAQNWMIDGIFYSVIILAAYTSVKEYFEP